MRYSLNCLSLPFSANYSSPGYFKCIEITFVPWSFKKYIYIIYWLLIGMVSRRNFSLLGQISHIPLGWHHWYLTAENKPPTFAGPASLGGKRWKHWEAKLVEKHHFWPKWPSAKQVQKPAYFDAFCFVMPWLPWMQTFKKWILDAMGECGVLSRKQCLTEPFKNPRVGQ